MLPVVVFCLWAPPAQAREVSLTLDAAPVEAPAPSVVGNAGSAAISPIAPISLDLPLSRASEAALAQAVQAASPTQAPALPKTALPAAAAARPAAAAAAESSDSLESASAEAAVRFDKKLSSLDGDDDGPAANWKLSFDAKEAAVFRAAVDRAGRSGWTKGVVEVRDAAGALLSGAGVAVETFSEKNRAGGPYPGLRVSPVLGHGPLNDLAYHLKNGLGVTLDYLPERTGNAVGAFNGREKRIMMAHFDRPEFFLGVLHEARHAYYSALLAKGEVRLFHAAVVARPGRTVSPYATVYANYFSMEELSTFPKTLKHLLTARRGADDAAARDLLALAGVRIRQYAEFLATTLHLAEQISARDGAGKLALRRMDAAESEKVGLDALARGAYYALDLPQAVVYLPFESEDSRTWLQRKLGSQDRLILDGLRLKARLLHELAEGNVETARAYQKAVQRGDAAEASRQADRLIKATLDADRDWRLGYAALLARGK